MPPSTVILLPPQILTRRHPIDTLRIKARIIVTHGNDKLVVPGGDSELDDWRKIRAVNVGMGVSL